MSRLHYIKYNIHYHKFHNQEKICYHHLTVIKQVTDMITTESMIRPRLPLVQVRLGRSYTEYIK